MAVVLPGLFIWGGWLSAAAAAVPDYRVGDVAEAEVVTPVALDVVDPVATVALRAAKAREVPVIFRSFPAATNGLTVEFLNVFTRAQANFLTAVAANFHTRLVTPEVMGSAEFGRFFTAFNEQSHFPVTTELAAEWVQGRDGAAVREALLGRLRQVSAEAVRPNDLPEGFVPGNTVRLVSVTVANQNLSPEMAQHGRLMPGSTLLSVAQAQQLFCDGFSAAEQRCARAVATLLKPNCFPDAQLTELVSGIAVCQLVATEHFAAGETVLHPGDRVDAKAKAALEALVPVLARMKKTEAPAAAEPAAVPVRAAVKSAEAPRVAVNTGLPGTWLILVLTGISVSALLFAWWQAVSSRRKDETAPPAATSTALAVPAETVTQLAQGMREAVMMELASQRRELLQSQQAATEEIAALVRRLDELQLPIQERERAYEARIQLLERELALRTEENRELLTVKLDSVRRQLEAERAANAATN